MRCELASYIRWGDGHRESEGDLAPQGGETDRRPKSRRRVGRKHLQTLPSDAQRTLAVIEIRQKFGTLTVYLSGDPTPAMSQAIDAAREASMVTCEVCGAPGTLAERRGWTSVKCHAHENWSRFDPRPAIPSP